MDIDKMIADYTDSLMAQAKKWQSMGYSAEISETRAEALVAVTSKETEEAPGEATATQEEEIPPAEALSGEFYAEVFAGVYPIPGAKLHIKNDGELIYLLTTSEYGRTDRVTLSYFGPYDYCADVFADGFEGKRDIPIILNEGEVCLRVQLMPLADEDG